MIAAGGVADHYLDDTWALDLESATWSPVVAGGLPARVGSQGFYDPVADRLSFFGGYDATNRCDVWTFDPEGGAEWHRLVTGPAPDVIRPYAAVYDEANHRVIVIGAQGMGGAWQLALGEPNIWMPLVRSEQPYIPEFIGTSIYDESRNLLIICGGEASGDEVRGLATVLSLDGAPEWSWLPQPPNRAGQAAVRDAEHDRLVVFGGSFSAEHAPYPVYYDDIWVLPLSGSPGVWSQLSPLGEPHPGRAGAVSAYDPIRRAMVVFGGYDANRTYRGETSVLSLGGTPAWSRMITTGASPSGRVGHRLVFDPLRDRVVLLGGLDPAGVVLHDVWELRLSPQATWRELHPAGAAPAGLAFSHCGYDSRRDRMVLHGGYAAYRSGSDRVKTNETWVLSLDGDGAWSRLDAATPPPPLDPFGAAYDPVGDRFVCFMGSYPDPEPPPWELWALSFANATTSVPAPDVAPGVRLGCRPNPGAGALHVTFTLASAVDVVLSVFDVTGRCVHRIAEGRFTAGSHELRWDGRNGSGVPLPAGLYFLRLDAGDSSAAMKVIRMS